MTAALHRDFLRLAVDNALTRPGAAAMLGSPVDLAKLDTDAYVVAGVADHLCPWQSCYRSTQLLGGRSRFVLSSSGHIASMVNPPGNAKASFRTAPDNPRTPPTGWTGRSPSAAPGGPTTSAGWSSAAAARRPGPGGSAPPASPRWTPAPGTYVLDR